MLRGVDVTDLEFQAQRRRDDTALTRHAVCHRVLRVIVCCGGWANMPQALKSYVGLQGIWHSEPVGGAACCISGARTCATMWLWVAYKLEALNALVSGG